MLKVSYKDLKGFGAIDITNETDEVVRGLKEGCQLIAASTGTNGITGVVFLSGGTLYKITQRSSSLFIIL